RRHRGGAAALPARGAALHALPPPVEPGRAAARQAVRRQRHVLDRRPAAAAPHAAPPDGAGLGGGAAGAPGLPVQDYARLRPTPAPPPAPSSLAAPQALQYLLPRTVRRSGPGRRSDG